MLIATADSCSSTRNSATSSATRETSCSVRVFQDVTHPEDLAASLEHFHSLMRGELPSFSLEKRYLRRDGSVVWGNVSLSIQNRSAGEPAYGIAILQDISELKKVEEKLRRASERLELAVRSSNVALGEMDLTAGPNRRAEWLNYWEQWGTGNPEDYPTAESMHELVAPRRPGRGGARHRGVFERRSRRIQVRPSSPA